MKGKKKLKIQLVYCKEEIKWGEFYLNISKTNLLKLVKRNKREFLEILDLRRNKREMNGEKFDGLEKKTGIKIGVDPLYDTD